jgi:hypothetical protein
MTPLELRDLIKPLNAGGPIYRQLEADLATSVRPPSPWYTTQKQHLLGWLGEYDGPGAYDRANWADRSAQFVYNHFQCAPALVWLAEALGVPSETLIAACDDVKKSGARAASQCGAFRRAVPWAMIEDRLLRQQKQETHFQAFQTSNKNSRPKPIGGFGYRSTTHK